MCCRTRQEAYLAKITADGARWRGVRDFRHAPLTDAAAYTRTGVSSAAIPMTRA